MAEPVIASVRRVLTSANPLDKLSHVNVLVSSYLPALVVGSPCSSAPVDSDWPQTPCRPSVPELVEPAAMPPHKQLGVPIPLYLLHGLAHIELNAVDMYADTVRRGLAVGSLVAAGDRAEFAHDFGSVLHDESRHFKALDDRLKEIGGYYGCMPARKVARLFRSH
jgi:uncharacterized ferritin-like protein (DUF455 family)